MAETTAFALIGQQGSSDWVAGFEPTHLMRLRENSRPTWVLSALSNSGGDAGGPAVVMVPSRRERILLDGIVLIAVEVIGDEQLGQALTESGVAWDGPFIDLAQQSPAGLRPGVHEAAVRAFAATAHLALAVLPTSTLGQQASSLRDEGIPHTLLGKVPD